MFTAGSKVMVKDDELGWMECTVVAGDPDRNGDILVRVPEGNTMLMPATACETVLGA